MNLSRRTLMWSAAAACAFGPAFAQGVDFRAAAAYSAARRGVSLLVMQHGRVLFEDYPNAGAPDRGWELASGTKSFTGVMAAAAVQDRALDLDEPVAETIREWRGDERARISIRHLLSLTSGLRIGMGQRPPTYTEAIETPAQVEPGAEFAYGPAPFQIFGEIIRRKFPHEADPAAYIQRRVFDRLSIAPTTWRRGRDRMPFMPQGAHFTARAWARFGQFVLQNGEGLVDAHALAQCFEGTRANPGYGLSFWLLRPGLVPPSPLSGVADIDMGTMREDIRMAAGAGDQRLYLIPRRGLVIARQANRIIQSLRRRGGERWNDADFLRYFAAL